MSKNERVNAAVARVRKAKDDAITALSLSDEETQEFLAELGEVAEQWEDEWLAGLTGAPAPPAANAPVRGKAMADVRAADRAAAEKAAESRPRPKRRKRHE